METVNEVTELTAAQQAEFSRLIEQSYSAIYRQAFLLSRNRQDAEDLTQEACYRAYRAYASFQEDRSFLNWIFRIVTRLYFDLRRYRSRRPEEVSHDAPLPGAGAEQRYFEPADTRPTPEEELVSKTIGDEILNALDELSPSQRQLVRLSDIKGLEADDVAKELNLSSSVLRSRLHRAHRAIRKQMAAQAEKEPKMRVVAVQQRRTPARPLPSDSWAAMPLSSLIKELAH